MSTGGFKQTDVPPCISIRVSEPHLKSIAYLCGVERIDPDVNVVDVDAIIVLVGYHLVHLGVKVPRGFYPTSAERRE